MKKKGIIIAIIVGLVVLLGIALISANNNLVTMEAEVDAALANIDTNLQRRADLIPNLVNTVKGYAAHEQEAIDKVTEARQNLTKASTVEEKAAADSALTDALNNLLVIVENYPDLQAHREIADAMQQNMYLQREITAARELYNDTINQWNRDIFAWPTKKIVAAKNGYTTRIPFVASKEIKEKAKSVFF